MDSLQLAELLSQLIQADDPMPVIWTYLQSLWRPEEESGETYFKQGEKRTMYLEKVLGAAYPELYREILPERCARCNLDVTRVEVPIIWMDALSLREALLLCSDLDADCELSFAYSRLPSETTFYKETIFYPWAAKTVEIKDVNWLSLDGDERGVWCPIPDKELEDIKGRVKVRTQTDIYEKSRQVLLNICEMLYGNEFLVTSDHGYISTETHFLTLPKRLKGAMQNLFDASRYVEVETKADALIEDGYIVEHDGYYLVSNRYAWPTRGKYKVMLHGGISLLECLVPVLRIAF
ncbi:MAG: hypothetical protein U9Q78_01345 [Chloroflexota bacterium]|nr:hypothetical protein [Chloroflexota bacterium]